MNISVVSPVEEYWQNYVMEVADSFTDDPPAGDTPRWHLAICFIASTGLVAACLIKGIRTFSKVVYFTAIVPYFIMLTIFFLSVSRPGSGYGLAELLKPDFRKLYHPKTWYAAGVHVFSSLGLSLGTLILLGSYNPWNYDFVTDAFVSLGWDFFCNIVAAMTVFGAIGFLSHDHGLPVSFYASSGPDVAFVVFAEALSKHPFPQIWSFLYYLMIFCFGLNQAIFTVDTLIDYLKKRFTRDYFLFTVFISIFTLGAFYIMGFSVITGLGYVFSRLVLVIFIIADMYTFYPTFCVTLSECISLLTAYTFRYMRSDVKPLLSSIMGSYVGWEKLWKQAIVILTIGALVTPVILVMMLLFAISTYNPFRQTICNFSRYYEYPFWIDELGWFFFCCFVLVLPVGIVLSLARVKGTVCQRIKAITSPSPYWAAQDEEADAIAREQLGIPVRIKPEPVRPKKPWEIHLEAYGKALALSEKELNKIKEREQRKRESKEKLEGFCGRYLRCCKCCYCCEEDGFDEEWEYEYESIEEEEEEEEGVKPATNLVHRTKDDDDDDDKKPGNSIEMKEFVSNKSRGDEDAEQTKKIEEKQKPNPSDLREQQQHHKWECVRWVREIEDVHKGSATSEPARSATIIVHEPQSPERTQEQQSHLHSSSLLSSSSTTPTTTTTVISKKNVDPDVENQQLQQQQRPKSSFLSREPLIKGSSSMSSSNNTSSRNNFYNNNNEKNKNKLRILAYDGPISLNNLEPADHNVTTSDKILSNKNKIINNKDNNDLLYNTPNALNHHQNHHHTAANSPVIAGGSGSRHAAATRCFKSGHSPYKVAASEISQFPFPPMTTNPHSTMRLNDRRQQQQLQQQLPQQTPQAKRQVVCLRNQKRSSDAEDLDSSLEDLQNDDFDSGEEEDDPSVVMAPPPGRRHRIAPRTNLNHAVDDDDEDDDDCENLPRRECDDDVGISTSHILDDIIRIETETVVDEDVDDVEDDVDEDDLEYEEEDGVEDLDEEEAERCLMNGAASSSGKEEEDEFIPKRKSASSSKKSSSVAVAAASAVAAGSDSNGKLAAKNGKGSGGGTNNNGNNNKKRLAKLKIFQSWGIVMQDETVNFV